MHLADRVYAQTLRRGTVQYVVDNWQTYGHAASVNESPARSRREYMAFMSQSSSKATECEIVALSRLLSVHIVIHTVSQILHYRVPLPIHSIFLKFEDGNGHFSPFHPIMQSGTNKGKVQAALVDSPPRVRRARKGRAGPPTPRETTRVRTLPVPTPCGQVPRRRNQTQPLACVVNAFARDHTKAVRADSPRSTWRSQGPTLPQVPVFNRFSSLAEGLEVVDPPPSPQHVARVRRRRPRRNGAGHPPAQSQHRPVQADGQIISPSPSSLTTLPSSPTSPMVTLLQPINDHQTLTFKAPPPPQESQLHLPSPASANPGGSSPAPAPAGRAARHPSPLHHRD